MSHNNLHPSGGRHTGRTPDIHVQAEPHQQRVRESFRRERSVPRARHIPQESHFGAAAPPRFDASTISEAFGDDDDLTPDVLAMAFAPRQHFASPESNVGSDGGIPPTPSSGSSILARHWQERSV